MREITGNVYQPLLAACDDVDEAPPSPRESGPRQCDQPMTPSSSTASSPRQHVATPAPRSPQPASDLTRAAEVSRASAVTRRGDAVDALLGACTVGFLGALVLGPAGLPVGAAIGAGLFLPERVALREGLVSDQFLLKCGVVTDAAMSKRAYTALVNAGVLREEATQPYAERVAKLVSLDSCVSTLERVGFTVERAQRIEQVLLVAKIETARRAESQKHLTSLARRMTQCRAEVSASEDLATKALRRGTRDKARIATWLDNDPKVKAARARLAAVTREHQDLLREFGALPGA